MAIFRGRPPAAEIWFTPRFTPWQTAKKNGLRHFCCNPLILLAEWTGLEPATPGVTGRYSNQLNYHSMWRVLRESRRAATLKLSHQSGVP
jgi:hypothetical protein